MKKCFSSIFLLFLFFSPLFAHDDAGMSFSAQECPVAKAFFLPDEPLETRIEYMKKAILEEKSKAFPIYELQSQRDLNFDLLLAADSTDQIISLLVAHLEIEKSAVLYTQTKLSQLTIILILILSSFLFITIWLTFVLNSSKHKAQKEMKIKNQIITGQELERKRISQELHDTITQDIRTAILHIRELKNSLTDTDKNKWPLVNTVESLAEENLRTIRLIIQNLTPPEIENENFGKLLANYSWTVTENRKIPCSFYSPEDTDFNRLTPLQKMNIFRIIQEAVSNAQLHSEATKINIIARQENRTDRFVFFISDDGKGFDTEQPVKNAAGQYSHYGLENMKNRADMLNGKLEISSSAEMGTEIKLSFSAK